MPDLKLISLDAEDLDVLSAHLQDAVIRASDMAYMPAAKRFAAVANRFDWTESVESAGRRQTRRRCGLRFERVLGAKVTGFQPGNADAVLSLLTIAFEQTDAPGGHITLTFSGGAAVRLDVECIEAELRDLGGAWAARARPRHGDGDASDKPR
jgi:hypothetical protein